MKNKSTRHKDENTFKFQPFSERISNINVDIFHKVRHEYELQTEDSCFFYQTIEKWNVLNLTEGYARFKKEIRANNYITLPQLLLAKDHVVDVLLKYLKENNPLHLQPILEIVVAVAQDLQKEFYPYYQQFLETLISLLNTKDTEQLEWVFTCLAYLLKFLWRPIIKNINEVFNSLLPLLSDSKPEYINSFAAESFAFVARKVKDKDGFLALLLKAVEKKKDGVSGCGKLLFEVVNGINGQFHSCAEQFLPFYIESLWNQQFSKAVLFDILKEIIANISIHIHPQKNQFLWEVLLKNISVLEEEYKSNKEEQVATNLELILKLLGQVIEHRSGKLLQNPTIVIQQLVRLLNLNKLPESLTITIIQISVSILLSKHIRLPQEQASQIIRKILGLDNKKVLIYFVENVSNCSSFEILILPSFLRKCSAYEFDEDCLYTLTKLLLKKAPLCFSGVNLANWVKYSLDFKEHSEQMTQKLSVLLDYDNYLNLESSFEMYFCSLICLPHILLKEDSKNILLSKLENNLLLFLKESNSLTEKLQTKKFLFLFNSLLECIVHMNNTSILEKHFSAIFNFLLKYACDVDYLCGLKSLSLLFMSLGSKDDIITMETLKMIDDVCSENFKSSYHEIRLLTAHIYTFFEKLPQFDIKYTEDPDIVPETWKVFSLCYEVESIEPLVQTYRDQIQRLEKLTYGKPQMLMCDKTEFRLIPLKYLCGVLYMNFRLLWEPVSKIIETHAHGLESSVFWSAFGAELRGVVENVRSPKKIDIDVLSCELDVLGDLFQESQKISVNPDFVNYRLLLWKAMGLFADIAEAKTRDVSELLLNFIENEYTKTNSEMATKCNIKEFTSDEEKMNETAEIDGTDKIDETIEINETDKIDTTGKIDETDKMDETDKFEQTHKIDETSKIAESAKVDETGDNMETDKIDESITAEKEDEIYDKETDKKSNKVSRNGDRKIIIKTLLNKLTVFSQFRSPKSMYREPELYRLYFDFLKHKNAEIQRVALDCIMTYKFKYLTPYKDHLYNLVDDKNFKHEITNFRVDKESSAILVEHRENLLPVILQIVFSKMSVKTGLRTGGKASSQHRRTLILRFLAGCEESEMLCFVEKAFALYSKYLRDNELEQAEQIIKSVDLENLLAPKKLLSTLNLLTVILEQFGGLMGNQLLTYLLKILFVVGSLIKGIFDQVANVHAGYLAILRNLRNTSIQTLVKFFEHFDNYSWTRTQINAVFTVFVWPYLDKLNMEGIHSPTALLKLFKQWGTNPRYFKLLVKHKDDDTNQYILPHIFKLLVNEKSNISVVNVIYEISESLLKYELSPEEMELELEVDDLLPVQQNILDRIKINDKLNYGSCILLPHVPVVLERVKRRLQRKHGTLNKTELFIMSRISELVWESDISSDILRLLLPIVQKKCALDEEIVLQFFTTIHNLVNNIENPIIHLKELTPLFYEATYPSCRKILVKTLVYIADKSCNENLKTASNLIVDLNAFDAKWLDQPDFERRHSAFKAIQTAIVESKIELFLGSLLVNSLFFLMKNEKDLSLKDNSFHTLKLLCPYLVKKYQGNQKDLEYILNDSIFTKIKLGMRVNNNNDFRNECISLLGHIARECPESHFALRDLNKLTNKEDLEVDFFENITHIQIHRQARAMTKFCQIIREETIAPNTKTVTQFLLPLASYYLVTEKFSGKNSVVDAAIDMVGVICRILPWHQYEGMLKYTLSKLRYKVEFQKQLVRLTVTILDAFHFDLSKGHVEVSKKKHFWGKNKKGKPKNDAINNTNTSIAENDESGKEKEPDIDEDKDVTDVNIEDVLEETYDEAEKDEADIEKGDVIVDKITVLCKSTATRVIKTIQGVLLPQLHKSLAELTKFDSSHKVNRKKTGIEREEEDMARVPISLAVVKLLQRLPKEILEYNLPGVFIKLCTFLKSRLESVRRVARETLQKIMLTLGPKYLKLLLGEMAPLLSRGFQVHVLVFTVHGVLNSLKSLYEPGDIDEVLSTVLNLCTADLFGMLSEEKEVVKITVKVSEARSTKSFDTLQILAQHITETSLMDMIVPISKLLESSHSYKTIQKAQDAFRHIALGLVDNAFIPVKALLKFAYETSAEKIPTLLPGKKPKATKEESEKARIFKEDCFIIPKIPGNRTAYRALNVRTSSDTNAHLLVEFGLRLCFVLLKREMVKSEEYRPIIDPFVAIFRNCLKSKHVKLCTLTLQCLQWVMKYELPSMKLHIKSITKDMFAVLHKYASAGLSKGDNFDLVVAVFKGMAVLVRDVHYYTVDTTQLKALLLYAEQDMHDNDRQATAFGLLKAIISRKLIVPEIHDVMGKVAELSVTSELSYVRTQARLVFHQFMMEYPLGNTFEKHLGFYISQMSFEMQYGRESAIEMIQLLINSFPIGVLKNHSGTLLITLGARLVNDDVPECRKKVADCISSMLKRLSKADRDPLFEVLTLWLKDKEISHRRLAAQVCGIFVTVENEDFETRLPIITPLILKQFGLTDNTPGKFVKIKQEKNTPDELQRVKDHHNFQVLQLILKLCAKCPAFLKQKEGVENLAYHAQTLLAYPHDWVRLASAQFLGFVLAAMDVDHLATLLVDGQSSRGYLCAEPEASVKSLALDLCDQLQPGEVKSDLAEQVIKNLVVVARILQKVPNDTGKKTNLFWLTKRIRKIVNSEVIENATSVILRTEVFKWIAGVATALDIDNIKPVLNHLLAPLVREMITTDEKDAPLRQLAKEVANHIKKRIGMDEYTKTLQQLQQNLSVKRAERKRSRTQLAVTDPEAYAKKKIKQHERKKVQKKRKLDGLRGKKSFKRRKVELQDNSEG